MRHQRFWWLLGGLVVLTGLSIVFAVTIGPANIAPGDVWGTIAYHLGLSPTNPVSRLRDGIVWDLRLPRVLTAAAVGAGLALCGTVIQALTRNPLADPYLLGLSAGASLGAVTALLLGLSLLMPFFAFCGAALALTLTLVLAQSLGAITPSRAVLAGLAISSLAAALTSFLIFWTATGDSYREILSWLMGSLSGVVWFDAGVAMLALLVVGMPLVISGKAMDAFAFGDVAAATLGINVVRTRWLLLGATALLTGVLVSISGSIGFVGLILPHAVRLIAGPRHRALLPLSALAGAIFMIWADTMARSVFSPRELPVGIVTAMVGAPAFFFVLLRYRRTT